LEIEFFKAIKSGFKAAGKLFFDFGFDIIPTAVGKLCNP